MVTPISVTPAAPDSSPPAGGAAGQAHIYNYQLARWETYANVADASAARQANSGQYCRANTPATQQYSIPLAGDPTAAQLTAAQAANPGRIDRNTPLVRVGPWTIPQDVFYGLYTPSDQQRYLAAKSYMEGLGHRIGGGDTAAPGTTGTVHVDASGRAMPNIGRNLRESSPDYYAGSQSYSLIAGSPAAGWQGQDLSVARAQMPFQPEGMITLQGMGERGLPSYAIPTSSLRTNNPWDPTIVNLAAKERALDLTAALVAKRAGYTAGEGLDLANLERQKQAAVAAGNIGLAFEIQNKMQKQAQNLGEWSSAYHHVAKDMGIPVPANPFEYAGDIATEYLKGTPTRDAERFSPVSGELLGVLPDYYIGGVKYGLGLQQDAWNQAVNRAREKGVSFADFLPASTYLQNVVSSKAQGPYGNLYGGSNYGGVETRKPLGEGVTGPQIHITSGSKATYPTPSAASDRLVGGKTVAGVAVETPSGQMTWEQAKKSGYFTPGQVAAIDAGLAQSKSMSEMFFAVQKPGEYTKTTELLRPSDIDLKITEIFGGGPVAAGLIQFSDYWLGGRTKTVRTDRLSVSEPEYTVGINAAKTGFEIGVSQKVSPSATETRNIPIESGIYNTMLPVSSKIPQRIETGISFIDSIKMPEQEAGKERELLSGLYEKIGIPALAVTGTVATEYGYAAGAPSVFSAGELGLSGVFASNPIGWGLGIGAGATMLFERSGRLGLTGETKETSVRSIGGEAGSYIYGAGSRFAQEQTLKGLMLYGETIAASKRMQEQVKERFGGIIPESGTGMYKGGEIIPSKFDINEAGTGLPQPLLLGTSMLFGLTSGTGMSKALSAGYTQGGEVSQGNKNILSDTYQGKLAKEAQTGSRTATPNWWETGPYSDVIKEKPVVVNIYDPFKSFDYTTRKGTAISTDTKKSQTTSTSTRTSTSSGYDTGFRYDYNYETVNRPSPPKSDLKLGEIPWLPSLGGGGGGGGASRRGHYPFVETLGFATAKRNPFAKFMRGKKSKSSPFAFTTPKSIRRRK